jgi:hypothetical protein
VVFECLSVGRAGRVALGDCIGEVLSDAFVAWINGEYSTFFTAGVSSIGGFKTALCPICACAIE